MEKLFAAAGLVAPPSKFYNSEGGTAEVPQPAAFAAPSQIVVADAKSEVALAAAAAAAPDAPPAADVAEAGSAAPQRAPRELWKALLPSIMHACCWLGGFRLLPWAERQLMVASADRLTHSDPPN